MKQKLNMDISMEEAKRKARFAFCLLAAGLFLIALGGCAMFVLYLTK